MFALKFVLPAVLFVSIVAAADNYILRRCDDEPCNPCLPQIENNTVIEPVPGLRATVEIIASSGTCPPDYSHYQWSVDWGNGVKSVKNISHISPEQTQYTYSAPGNYNVTVGYCAVPFFCCEACTYVSQVITIQ